MRWSQRQLRDQSDDMLIRYAVDVVNEIDRRDLGDQLAAAREAANADPDGWWIQWSERWAKR